MCIRDSVYTEHNVSTVRVLRQVITFSCHLFAKKSSRTCAVTLISMCCSGHVYRVQLRRQTIVTAGVKSGPSYRPDAAIDCSRLTKCKRARVTEWNRSDPNNRYWHIETSLAMLPCYLVSRCLVSLCQGSSFQSPRAMGNHYTGTGWPSSHALSTKCVQYPCHIINLPSSFLNNVHTACVYNNSGSLFYAPQFYKNFD